MELEMVQELRESQARRQLLDQIRIQEVKALPAEVSAFSLLILKDVEIAFSAGAWLSVIVLSQSAIEGTWRQIFLDDYETKALQLFGSDKDLQWLRSLRNELVHPTRPGTKSSLWKVAGDGIAANHLAMAGEAQRAITLAYREITRLRI